MERWNNGVMESNPNMELETRNLPVHHSFSEGGKPEIIIKLIPLF
jgi:hypothetical protein